MYLRKVTGNQKITSLFGAAFIVFLVSASPSVWVDQIVNRSLSNQEIDDYRTRKSMIMNCRKARRNQGGFIMWGLECLSCLRHRWR